MTKAFLDTTILAEILLKNNTEIIKNLSAYEAILLPSYAIKEFKRGPLRAYIWLYNKVIATSSWSDAIASISGVYRQRNLSSTALAAVADFTKFTSSLEISSEQLNKIPNAVTLGDFYNLQARTWLKTKIFSAWYDLFRPPFERCCPLHCYQISTPVEKRSGIIDARPKKCTLGSCSVQDQLLQDTHAAAALREICKASAKPEMSKRAQVLRSIAVHPSRGITETDCIRLGDVVFALQCPSDAVILTTNIVDHEPLADAVNKRATVP